MELGKDIPCSTVKIIQYKIFKVQGKRWRLYNGLERICRNCMCKVPSNHIVFLATQIHRKRFPLKLHVQNAIPCQDEPWHLLLSQSHPAGSAVPTWYAGSPSHHQSDCHIWVAKNIDTQGMSKATSHQTKPPVWGCQTIYTSDTIFLWENLVQKVNYHNENCRIDFSGGSEEDWCTCIACQHTHTHTHTVTHLLLPIASISSIKTIEGECSSATRNNSRTSLGPSPCKWKKSSL